MTDDLRQRGFVPDPAVGEGIPDFSEEIASGEMTPQAASELMQAAARRHAAEHGPSSDTDADGLITRGGFGSGQGMEKQRAGGAVSSDGEPG